MRLGRIQIGSVGWWGGGARVTLGGNLLISRARLLKFKTLSQLTSNSARRLSLAPRGPLCSRAPCDPKPSVFGGFGWWAGVRKNSGRGARGD